MKKISYLITVSSEIEEIQKLIPYIQDNKRSIDQIVVLFDSKNGSKEITTYLRSKTLNGEFNWVSKDFNNNFAEFKNFGNSLCSGDFIFQLDADEMPSKNLIKMLPLLIEQNPEVDLYLVPRVNIVKDITPDHLKKWNWRIDEQNRINWPDLQGRITRNTPEIKWKNKVHEQITGHSTYVHLPIENEWALQHIKTIQKQEKQNSYYNTL